MPTLCRLCNRWQRALFCTTCLHTTAAPSQRCSRCAIPLPKTLSKAQAQSPICTTCDSHPPMFDHALAAVDYCAPWSNLVAQLKFQRDPALARPLTQLLMPHVWARWQLPAPPRGQALHRLRAGAPSLILPVPLSPQRLSERGYNQAGLLATHMGRGLQLPVNHQLLHRRQHTQRLMLMEAQERQAHIRGAFSLAKGASAWLRQRHVAVVDDVLTTGATLNEVARVLWQGGAREISVWVIARTPLLSLGDHLHPSQFMGDNRRKSPETLALPATHR